MPKTIQSKIDKNLEYVETKKIDKQDINKESVNYETFFDNISNIQSHHFILGSPNYTYIKKYNIVFFPIYLTINNETKSRIGLIEFKKEDLPNIMDEDGDVDPDYTEDKLLFSFFNKKFVEKLVKKSNETKSIENNKKTNETEKIPDNIDIINVPSNLIDNDIKNDEIEFEVIEPNTDDVFNVKIPVNNEKIKLQDKIFEIDLKKNQPEPIPEETKKDAAEIKEDYRKSSTSNWIEKFMQNNNYDIIDNEGGGDCFFAVVRDAFQQIGKSTSVDKLRNLVANETSNDVFQNFRKIYLDLENEIFEIDKDIKTHTSLAKQYIQRSKKDNFTQEEHKEISKPFKESKEKIKILKKSKLENQKFLNDNFSFMKNIDNLEKFKDYIRTSAYWADSNTISILEFKLNVKFIILSEAAFNENDKDSVLKCGELHPKIQKNGIFTPDAYIICSYSGDHYKLVSYKKKKIFAFREIPYDIKNLIINKCLEKNSGTFSLIEDFRNLKIKFGFIPDEIDNDDDDEDNFISNLGSYDPNVTFMFHSNSYNKKIPGTGSGESIPKDKLHMFKNLNQSNWRRKLDDSFIAPFELDNHKWNSVKHYYQGSKYKKRFPDYYLSFSIDSDSDISKDVELAKKKGSKIGQEPRVKIDPDFYGSRSVKERQNAIKAKFEQNPELKDILISTYPAKLVKFVRGNKPSIDSDLLEIRKKFIDEK